jgi:hypothetical protein
MYLILTPNLKEDAILVKKAAKSLGFDVFIAPSQWRLSQEMLCQILGQHGIVYGEAMFCEVIAQQLNWKLYSNSQDWLTKLPHKYVNRKISLTTMGAARKEQNKMFIKPADDIKSFEAKVYMSGADLHPSNVLNDIPVLISEEMNFTSEYRCFVKNRKVVSVCCYKYLNEANKKEHYQFNNDLVIAFVNDLLRDDAVACAPGAVIDVGKFKKEEFAVIEANPAYASGVYGCEIIGALEAIIESIEN